jgi:hypothetical protein
VGGRWGVVDIVVERKVGEERCLWEGEAVRSAWSWFMLSRVGAIGGKKIRFVDAE